MRSTTILSEAVTLSHFHWSEMDKRAALFQRVDLYLNRSRLQTILVEVLAGLNACHEQAAKDARAFFQFPKARALKRESAEELLALLDSLMTHVASLNGTLEYSLESYAGSSGVSLPEVLALREALEAGDQQRVRDEAEGCQNRRTRTGIDLVGRISRAAEKLTIAFDVERLDVKQQR